MSPTLSNLIYTSTATAEMTQLDLVEIATQAASNNERRGISGMLLYCKGSFLQVLEGERDMVDAVFKTIRYDTRHNHLALVLAGPISKRHFEQWSMGFCHVTAAIQSAEPFAACFDHDSRTFNAGTLQERPGLALHLLLNFAGR